MGCDEDPRSKKRTVEIILEKGHFKGEGSKSECPRGKENQQNLRNHEGSELEITPTITDTPEVEGMATIGNEIHTRVKASKGLRKRSADGRAPRKTKKKINLKQKSIKNQIEQWFMAARKAYWIGYDVNYESLRDARPKEWEQIMGFFCNEEKNSKHALYITGTPGTGKSVFVGTVVKKLQKSIQQNSEQQFMTKRIFSYNGMSIIEHISKYVREKLFMEHILRDIAPQEIKASKAHSPKIDYKFYVEKLKKYLCGPNAIPTAIIIDEMDHLDLESRDGIVNTLLRWATENNSQLWLIGISNTMDLIKSNEKHYISKERGLFKWDECHFMPYEASDISSILLERLKAILDSQEKSNSSNTSSSRNTVRINWSESNYGIHPLALEICARKIANTGDVRKALSIFRTSIDDACDYNRISLSWPYIITPEHIAKVMAIGPNTGLSSEPLKAMNIHIQLILLAIAKAKMENSDTPSLDVVFHKYKEFVHQINISLTPLIREELFDSIAFLQNQGYLSLESMTHSSKSKSHSMLTNFVKPQMSVDTILSAFRSCEHLHSIIDTVRETSNNSK